MERGEIWQIDLNPAVGAEIQKVRPALIVSVDALGKLPLRVVVPITGWKEHYQEYPWMVRLDPSPENGLVKVSSADCFQIRSVSVERLSVRVGAAPTELVARVQKAIGLIIGAL
jgi:mRNA interferase MazF